MVESQIGTELWCLLARERFGAEQSRGKKLCTPMPNLIHYYVASDKEKAS